MGDYYYNKDAGRKSATGVGTTAGVTVTITGATGQVLDCTGIQVSGDLAAVVTVESPANTVLWQKRFSAAFASSEAWGLGSIVGASGANLLVKISASTAHSEANIQAIARTG